MRSELATSIDDKFSPVNISIGLDYNYDNLLEDGGFYEQQAYNQPQYSSGKYKFFFKAVKSGLGSYASATC